MKKATIIHHQGFGDIFSNVSICNYYSEKYQELIVLVQDEKRKKIIDTIYHNNHKIKCEIAETILHNQYESSCINCMTPGKIEYCPRDYTKCRYINYEKYVDYDNLKIGCFNENYYNWENFVNSNKKIGRSFSHSFYDYQNLSSNVRIDFFKINRLFDVENEKYSKLSYKKYIVVHDDEKRGMKIHKNIPNLEMYQLNSSSDSFIDQIKIIEECDEIHMIDSSWSVLIYFLSFHNKIIENKPKYLHCYVNYNRDFNIYTLPTPNNWYFIN